MAKINPSVFRVWALLDLTRHSVIYAHVDRKEVVAFYSSFLCRSSIKPQGFRLIESLRRDNFGLVAMEPNTVYARKLKKEGW